VSAPKSRINSRREKWPNVGKVAARKNALTSFGIGVTLLFLSILIRLNG